jgi:suppressor of G2 allele of SKP1
MTQVKIRHEWFQSDSAVSIAIFVKKVEEKDVEVGFGAKTLSVTIKLSSGSHWNLDLDPLFQDIIPSECSYSILSTQVLVKLVKKVPGIKWESLEGTGETVNLTSMMADAPKEYPSSSKKKHNWDLLAKDVDSDKPEGEQALNALFQSIYANASEDTKRAMMKSYVESNGTCLSTNWEDIGKRKVDITPPDGMVAKKFE